MNLNENFTVPKKEEVFIKKGDSMQQILAASSVKLHTIGKNGLYYKHPVVLHYSNGSHSIIFDDAQDMHFFFKRNVFKNVTFHITSSIDWQEEAKVREQVKFLYIMLNSLGWQLEKTQYSPENIPFPLKTEAGMLFVWTADNTKISMGIQRMTFPKELFPRNGETYRLSIHITDLQ